VRPLRALERAIHWVAFAGVVVRVVRAWRQHPAFELPSLIAVLAAVVHTKE
jgi:hypothetical protein